MATMRRWSGRAALLAAVCAAGLGAPQAWPQAVVQVGAWPPGAKSPMRPPRSSDFAPPWPPELDWVERVGGALAQLPITGDNSFLAGFGTYVVQGTGDVRIAAQECDFPDYFRVYVEAGVTSLTLRCETLRFGKGVKIQLKPLVLAPLPHSDRVYPQSYYCERPEKPVPVPPRPPEPAQVACGDKGSLGDTGAVGQSGRSGTPFRLEVGTLAQMGSLWIDTSGCPGGAGGPGGHGGRGGPPSCGWDCQKGEGTFTSNRGGDGGDGGRGGLGGPGGSTAAVNIAVKNGFPGFGTSGSSFCTPPPFARVSIRDQMFPANWPEARSIVVWGQPGEGGVPGPGGSARGGEHGLACKPFGSRAGGSNGVPGPVGHWGALGACGAVTVER